MAWARLATGSGFTKGSKAANLGEAVKWCVDGSRLARFGFELDIHGRKLKQTFKTPGVF